MSRGGVFIWPRRLTTSFHDDKRIQRDWRIGQNDDVTDDLDGGDERANLVEEKKPSPPRQPIGAASMTSSLADRRHR